MEWYYMCREHCNGRIMKCENNLLEKKKKICTYQTPSHPIKVNCYGYSVINPNFNGIY